MRQSRCVMAGGKRQNGARWRGELVLVCSCPMGLQIWEGPLLGHLHWPIYPPCDLALSF